MPYEVSYNTVEDYLSSRPAAVRKKLETIRSAIKKAAPEATEKISYNMPAFFQNGVLVYYASFTNHIGFFPTAAGVEAFKNELDGYEISKGTIRIPFDKPIPLDLIGRIVRFRVEMNSSKAKAKKK